MQTAVIIIIFLGFTEPRPVIVAAAHSPAALREDCAAPSVYLMYSVVKSRQRPFNQDTY